MGAEITPLRIKPTVQNYAWGRKGNDSLVAKLSGGINPDLPYAELWFGAHPSSPSEVSGTTLDKLIASDPQSYLGESICKRYDNQLPFLFKVLSIEKPLSIQAHPDLALARKLHQRDPKNYPDANHKPEIAVAVTPLTLLYGFQDIHGIRTTARQYPELEKIISADTKQLLNSPEGDKYVSALLKKLLTDILFSAGNLRSALVQALMRRIGGSAADSRDALLANLVEQYGPEDSGVFTSMLMNLESVSPGQAVYIGPNIPHSYIRGDLLECMANSDNVVRAGLTNKFQDLQTLGAMLSYQPGPVQQLRPTLIDPPFGLYQTPAAEFEVQRFSGPSQSAQMKKSSVKLLFCLEGEALVQGDGFSIQLSAGDALFVPFCCASATIVIESGTVFKITVPQ